MHAVGDVRIEGLQVIVSDSDDGTHHHIHHEYEHTPEYRAVPDALYTNALDHVHMPLTLVLLAHPFPCSHMQGSIHHCPCVCGHILHMSHSSLTSYICASLSSNLRTAACAAMRSPSHPGRCARARTLVSLATSASYSALCTTVVACVLVTSSYSALQ
jgi:hypothetical protein